MGTTGWGGGDLYRDAVDALEAPGDEMRPCYPVSEFGQHIETQRFMCCFSDCEVSWSGRQERGGELVE